MSKINLSPFVPGDWATFVQLMGGPTASRKDQPIRLYKVWSDEPGRYGEPKGEQIKGIEGEDFLMVSRTHMWQIGRPGPEPNEVLNEDADSGVWLPEGEAHPKSVSIRLAPEPAFTPLEFCQ